MPTISVKPGDFFGLLGSQTDEKGLEQMLDLVKGEFKGIDVDGSWRIELNDTNRPDLWSAEGIARQIRAAQGKRRDYPFFKGPANHRILVDSGIEPIRPFVAAFVVRGLKVTEDILVQVIQTQEKLAENFGRKRRDVAIGVYNVEKIHFPVHYLAVDPKEHAYVPLGLEESLSLADILERHPKGIEYRGILEGSPRVPLLRDDAGMILSMPPIINSRDVGEVAPGDSELFVEATGTSLDNVILSLNILACDLADRGGRIERVKTVFPFDTRLGREVDVPNRLDQSLTIPLTEFSRLLGVEVKPGEVDNVLERYGCDVSLRGKELCIAPPPTRADYLHMVDVVEDFAIARGYETFSPRMPQDFSPGRPAPVSVLEDKVRDHMIGMGYEEIISSILVSRSQLEARMNLAAQELVEVSNVMNENYAVLRNSVLPSLLQVEAHSGAASYPHRLFEVGEVAVFDASSAHGSRTELHLCGLSAHGEATLSELHADADFLLFQLGAAWRLSETEHPSFLPGRAAVILVEDRPVGLLGEIHPEVLERWEISMPVAAFEMNLHALL